MAPEFISGYEFGRIIIENKTYTSDLIILGTKVKPKWWRKRGHNLVKDDLKEVVEFRPETLIIGTGAHGMMNVPAELSENLDFEILSYPTKEAIEKYNQEIKKEKIIAGGFHLTC